MAMDYNIFVSTIANLSALDSTQPEFIQIMPQVISYAEDRIYRELDILNSVYVNSSSNLTAGNRSFSLPIAFTDTTTSTQVPFLTVQGINLIYSSGQRQVLQPVALTYLNYVWGSPINSGLPEYFSMVNQNTMVVGPWPDSGYQVEVIGTFQPVPMSQLNPTTFLTTYLPDLLIAAGMIFFSGYMRDFGSQADNPQQSQSWENQYQTLFKSANLLELRKKFAGPGWTSLSSVPVTPVR